MRQLDLIFQWIRRASPYALFWLGGPLLLYIWTLSGPFLRDDLHLLLKAERFARGETKDWQLFRFAKTDEEWNELRSRGTFPWWAPETGRLDYFRPIPALSFHLDQRLFGRWAPGHRLMSLTFFSLALLAVRWMFLQAGCGPMRAGAATFFFGISQTLTPPVTWVCNRADLFALLGVVIAAGAYWRARSHPRLLLAGIAAIGYAFALLSKEAAVPLFAVVAAHELWTRRRREHRWTQPVAGTIALVLFVMAAIYLGCYFSSRPWAATHGGSDGVPSQVGVHGPLAILLYAAVWTIGFPIDALLALGDWHALASAAVAAIGGLLGLIAIRFLWRSSRGDPAAGFFALWAILFMLPALRSVAPNTRLLCLATLGWSYLLIGLILPDTEARVALPRLLRHWYYAANGIVSVGCAVGTVLFMNAWETEARQRIHEIVAECLTPLHDGDAVIVRQAQGLAESTCSGDRLEYLTGVRNASFAHVLPPDVDAITSLEDDRTLLVQGKGVSLFGSALHALTLPADWKPRAGHRFNLRDFVVEITEVRSDDYVRAMRLRFNEPLSSPRLHLHPPPLQTTAAPHVTLRVANVVPISTDNPADGAVGAQRPAFDDGRLGATGRAIAENSMAANARKSSQMPAKRGPRLGIWGAGAGAQKKPGHE